MAVTARNATTARRDDVNMMTRTIHSVLAAVLLTAGACTLPAFGATKRWAVAVFPSGAEFSIEVAVTDAERARGYMYREKVEPNQGMLFLFDQPGRHSFWMKNCRVALDIIWLDASYRVVHIEHDQPPCPAQGDCPSIVPMQAGSYVLEVAAGIAGRHELKIGDQLVILAEPALR